MTSCLLINDDKLVIATSFDGEIVGFDVKGGEWFTYYDCVDPEMSSNIVHCVNGFPSTGENRLHFLTGQEDQNVVLWKINEYEKIELCKKIPGSFNSFI